MFNKINTWKLNASFQVLRNTEVIVRVNKRRRGSLKSNTFFLLPIWHWLWWYFTFKTKNQTIWFSLVCPSSFCVKPRTILQTSMWALRSKKKQKRGFFFSARQSLWKPSCLESLRGKTCMFVSNAESNIGHEMIAADIDSEDDEKPATVYIENQCQFILEQLSFLAASVTWIKTTWSPSSGQSRYSQHLHENSGPNSKMAISHQWFIFAEEIGDSNLLISARYRLSQSEEFYNVITRV